MNGLESDYSVTLERRRLAGEILRWDFEPVKLRLANATYYTPDFRVVREDGVIEFHETKGWWRDDARVKIKVAAEQHPYKFIAITRRTKKLGGGWKIEEF